MKFKFSRQDLSPKEQTLERVFEILPGAISWLILAGLVVLAFCKPVYAAIFIIAFDLFWLMRLLYMTIFLLLSYARLWAENKTDWLQLAAGLNDIDGLVKTLKQKSQALDLRNRISFSAHKKEMETLKKSTDLPPALEQIYHLVIYPVIKESRSIVEPAIKSLLESEFPPERIFVVVTIEDRAEKHIKEDVLEIQKKYRSHFLDLLVVYHPNDLPGEARVKGANVTYGAKAAGKELAKRGIPSEQVILSCFDADTVVESNYFSCLTYYFMVTPDRHRASYQPIPVYHNNIWDVPGFVRVLSIGSSFFQLIEATNPENLVTFSSHSMSFKALEEIDYWPVDIISDDSAVFWKAFLHFNGNYRVIPMYTTLSMHAPEAASLWQTAVSIYKQQRRWAWGVENFPILMRGFLANSKISLFTKIRHTYDMLENHISWSTWAFLITVIGWLPALFAGREFSDTVLYYSAPRITTMIFNLSTLALIASIIISLLLLPKKKMKWPLLRRIVLMFEWLMVPLTFVFLGAIPALDAQTRLMFGRYMEFWVTDKGRK
jgi:hypothetical protein